MVTKCPVCGSKKITESKKGIECKNCDYVWKPNSSNKLEEVKQWKE